MAAQVYDAPAPEVNDGPDGRYFRFRFAQALADVGDEIRFDLDGAGQARAIDVTLTLLELVDPVAPTVTTFPPEVGTAPLFGVNSIDGRSVSATSNAPSRSQTPLAIDAQVGAVHIRPKPSAPCTVQAVAVFRVGHRV